MSRFKRQMGWKDVADFNGVPGAKTEVRFAPVVGQQWRVVFGNGDFRVVEMKGFAE